MTEQSPRTPPGDAPNSEGLRSAAGWCYFVASVALIGAVVAGIALVSHKVCGVNPYDDSLTDCSTGTHPYSGAGWAILVGGVAQASVVFVLARVTQVVANHRDALLKLLAEHLPPSPSDA